MKFSDTISNQSTLGFFSRTWAKWTVRRPTPKPRFGWSKRGFFLGVVIAVDRSAFVGRSGRTAPESGGRSARGTSERRLLVLDRHGAAAVALARVLRRAAVVAGRAAALTLARVHALAG